MTDRSSPVPPSSDEGRASDTADLARRLRDSPDPRARLMQPLSLERRTALAERWMAGKNIALPSAASRRWTWTRRRAALALAFAAALAAGLFVFMPAPPAPVATWTVSGDQQNRGPNDQAPDVVVVRPDTLLRIAVALDRRADEVKSSLLLVRAGRAAPVPGQRRTTDGQVLLVEQRAEDLLGPETDGPAELVWIGGAVAPDDDEAVRIALGGAPARGLRRGALVVLRRAIVLEGWQKSSSLGLHGGVEITGCGSMRRDGTCEIADPRLLTLWGPSTARVLVDDRPLAPTETIALGSGARRIVTIPRGATSLRIAGDAEERRFSLRDAPAPSPALTQATAAFRAGKLDEAEAMLGGVGGVGADAGLAATRLQARIAARRAAAGQRPVEQAQQARIAVGRAAIAAGRDSEGADDLLAAAFSRLTVSAELAGAKALIDEAEGNATLTADSLVFWEYLHALWARETGDLGTALDDLQRAQARAARLGLADLAGDVTSALSELLAALGRENEALALCPTPSGEGCPAATAATNRGWVRFIAGGDLALAAADMRDALTRAGSGCPELRSLLALNASYVEEALGHHPEAAKLLSSARAAARPDDARIAVWNDRQELMLALSTAPERALQIAARLTRSPGEASPEIRFEAGFGRAQALAALGRAEDATAAFGEADDALDDWMSKARLGQGRESLMARRSSAPRTWITWFLGQAEQIAQAKDPSASARAAAMARLKDVTWRSLSRGARTLSPSASSQARPTSPVPPPAQGELRILIHPLTAGVLVLAWSAEGITPLRVPVPTGAPLLAAQALLAPFASELARAARVELLVDASLAALPFEAADIQGRPLAEIAPFHYRLGMASRQIAPPPGKPRALVVLDPKGDLPGARSSRAAGDLRRRGFEVTELRAEEATTARVLAALRSLCGGLFHYEGHGVHRGIDGQEAGLLLADGDIEVRHVRALPCAPRAVVLAACDAAHPAGFALAHAFVERGASAVIGAAAGLNDALAAQITTRLYQDPAVDPFDLPAAATSALRALHSLGGVGAPAAPSGLRVLGP